MIQKVKQFAIAAGQAVGLFIAFLLAIATLGWLQHYDPWTSIAALTLGIAGAILTWRHRTGLSRTATVFLAIFSVIALVRASTWLSERSAENQLALAAQQKKEREAEQARLAFEAEAKAKAEKEELASLRKTDVEGYLARLKGIDMSKWLDEAKTLSPKTYAAHQEEMRRQSAATELERQRKYPKDYLTLDFTWKAGGFGAVMVADFVVKSTLQFPVRDIAVRCVGSGNSGTELGVVRQTLYEVIPAKTTKRINNISMGFIPGQMTRARCEITSVRSD